MKSSFFFSKLVDFFDQRGVQITQSFTTSLSVFVDMKIYQSYDFSVLNQCTAQSYFREEKKKTSWACDVCLKICVAVLWTWSHFQTRNVPWKLTGSFQFWHQRQLMRTIRNTRVQALSLNQQPGAEVVLGMNINTWRIGVRLTMVQFFTNKNNLQCKTIFKPACVAASHCQHVCIKKAQLISLGL